MILSDLGKSQYRCGACEGIMTRRRFTIPLPEPRFLAVLGLWLNW
jgi:hypothetical protein